MTKIPTELSLRHYFISNLLTLKHGGYRNILYSTMLFFVVVWITFTFILQQILYSSLGVISYVLGYTGLFLGLLTVVRIILPPLMKYMHIRKFGLTHLNYLISKKGIGYEVGGTQVLMEKSLLTKINLYDTFGVLFFGTFSIPVAGDSKTMKKFGAALKKNGYKKFMMT